MTATICLDIAKGYTDYMYMYVCNNSFSKYTCSHLANLQLVNSFQTNSSLSFSLFLSLTHSLTHSHTHTHTHTHKLKPTLFSRVRSSS